VLVNRRALFLLVGLVLLLGIGTWWWLRQPATQYPQPRRVSYRVTVSNTTNRALEGGKLWLLAPQAYTPSQRLDGLAASLPYEAISDDYANQQLEFALPALPPYGQTEIVVEAALALAETPNRWGGDAPPYWRQPQPGIQSDDPRIAELAGSIEGEDPVAAIGAWLDANLERSAYDSQDRGALVALEQRGGDCSEFAYLGAALARAKGLPARVAEGWVVSADGPLEAGSFHAWTEIWQEGTWRVLDAHRQGRDEADGAYLTFRVIPPDPEAFSASFTRFRFEGAGLTALMH
jgi:transglutaminase-like putative cysteine protease